MKILLTFDTGYAPHAATVMESIIQNCPEKLDFAVIYYDLNVDTQNILTNHFAEKVNILEFYQIEENIIMNFKSEKSLAWVSLSGLLRLFAPKFLINDSHVIYLDCDIIVQDNILSILNDADLSKPVCAVAEYDPAYQLKDLSNLRPIERPFPDPFIYEAYWFRTYKDLKMNVDAKYFNTGVMIINLDYWREYHVMEKALIFLKENFDKAFCQDQDALNHVINGGFFALHPKWNNVVVGSAVLSNYPVQELTLASYKPSIIHFAGQVKLWHYMGYTKHQKVYQKYRKMTPWPKVEYKNVSIKQIFIKRVCSPAKKFIGKVLFCFVGESRKHSLISFLRLNASANSFWAKARL